MKGFSMSGLQDGTYDVVVVGAEERGDGSLALELAVSSGPHRGEVVDLLATNLRQSWTDLLAAPGTLVVKGGQPRFSLDP